MTATITLASNRRTGTFERRVARALEAARPAAFEARPLVVACSGGPDSTATLVAVARSRPAAGHEVVAAYFDHGWRSRAATTADAALVAALAGALGVRFVCGTAASSRRGPASEARARRDRYRWLAGVCREAGADVCVTGHTLDDQAETVLLRLARGTGLAGAGAMAPVAPWPVRGCGQGVHLVRPLLAESRVEVERYLRALGVRPRRDPTNASLRPRRNRLRRRVLPELRRLNPRAAPALARFAAQARADEAALAAWAAHAAARLIEFPMGAVEVRRRPLLALPPAIAARVLRLAAAEAGCTLEAPQVRQLLRLARRRGARLALRGATVEASDERVRIVPRAPSA